MFNHIISGLIFCIVEVTSSVAVKLFTGADIIMQLDDVVHSLTTGPRVEEAMHRFVLIYSEYYISIDALS